jgi:hypothetical protein
MKEIILNNLNYNIGYAHYILFVLGFFFYNADKIRLVQNHLSLLTWNNSIFLNSITI